MSARHRRPPLPEQLLELLLPAACAGCGAAGHVLCPACLAKLRGAIGRCESACDRLVPAAGGPALPVWRAARYEGPVRAAIVSWKELGRHEVSGHLADALAAALRSAWPALVAAHGAIDARGPIRLVPIPSTPAANRRRGRALVPHLAELTANRLANEPGAPEAMIALARRRGAPDQAGLSARARARNRSGSLRRVGDVAGRAVVLIDDLVTTGASLLEAERELAAGGGFVLGAGVVAATPQT